MARPRIIGGGQAKVVWKRLMAGGTFPTIGAFASELGVSWRTAYRYRCRFKDKRRRCHACNGKGYQEVT